LTSDTVLYIRYLSALQAVLKKIRQFQAVPVNNRNIFYNFDLTISPAYINKIISKKKNQNRICDDSYSNVINFERRTQ
jgi:hypothetical protein